jgi:hypothetical protein
MMKVSSENSLKEFIEDNTKLFDSTKAISYLLHDGKYSLTEPHSLRVAGNTIVVGTTDTGKFHTALAYAKEISLCYDSEGNSVQNRSIVIVNICDTGYDEIPEITIEELKNPQTAKDLPMAMVCIKDDLAFDELSQLITGKVVNTIFIFPDVAPMLNRPLSKLRKTMLSADVKFGNDLIFEFHSFAEIPKALWENTPYFIIKETIDKKIKHHQYMGDIFNPIMEDIRLSNSNREVGRKWGTIMIDFYQMKFARLKGESYWGVGLLNDLLGGYALNAIIAEIKDELDKIYGKAQNNTYQANRDLLERFKIVKKIL